MILPVVVWLCAALAAAWFGLALLDRWRRRTYNLTVAERGGSGATPDFLKVDRAKREAALERGRPVAETPPMVPPPTTRWSRITGYAATVCAGLTLIVAALTALTSVEDYTKMAGEAANLVANVDAIGAGVRDYWPGSSSPSRSSRSRSTVS